MMKIVSQERDQEGFGAQQNEVQQNVVFTSLEQYSKQTQQHNSNFRKQQHSGTAFGWLCFGGIRCLSYQCSQSHNEQLTTLYQC
jgi:hypothetical protein